MVKKTYRPPDPEQVVALLLGNEALTPRGKKRQMKFPTVEGAAKMLSCRPAAVRRVAKAFLNGGIEAAKALCWKPGPKRHCFDNITQEAMVWAVAKSTLYNQVGLTLKARAI